MKTTFFLNLFFVFLFTGSSAFAQVGIITTTPSAKSILDLPRMTTNQHLEIASNSTTDKGLQVFDTDTNSIWYWSGVEWKNI